jgi:hypothetical protein
MLKMVVVVVMVVAVVYELVARWNSMLIESFLFSLLLGGWRELRRTRC